MERLKHQFLMRYPEFKQLDDGEIIELFLSDAQAEISASRWGKLYGRGVMALTAHFLKLRHQTQQNNGEAHRHLASESAGELSVSYQPTSGQNSEEFYQLTAYGQEFLRLKRLVGVGVMVA